MRRGIYGPKRGSGLTNYARPSRARDEVLLTMDAPPPLPPRNPGLQIFLGALVANAAGGVLLAAINWFVRSRIQDDISTFVLWPSFFLLPFFVGLLAAWFWRRLDRTLGWSFLDALWVTLLGLGAAFIVLREGIVCIVIV